jgi:single-stranded-DNA-specific exonuclease
MASDPGRLSLTGARWVAPRVPDEVVERLAASAGWSPVVARVAAIRWPDLGSPSEIVPSYDQLLDPYGMLGMSSAVERLRRAVRDRQHVRIITDYDVDGTTSSLILQAAIKLLDPSATVSWHIPSRFSEGYGFSVPAADRAAELGADLLVTADIGVRDHAAIHRARERGLDVLVCDHHLPAGESVPTEATVLCPPQAACSYGNPYLAACGISLKVAQALLAAHPKRDVVLRSLIKLAAIGTVADLVPLTTPENRAIVALGLAELNRGPHAPGLTALLKVSGLEPGQVRERELGFRIGPRINAAGRVAEANLVVRLLSSRDPVEAERLAAELDGQNTARRDIQEKLVERVLASLPDQSASFVVCAGPEAEGWHRGVVGIVASRVKDQVHRPVAIVSIQDELAVGSVRSIPGVHAVRALDSCADLLVKYGGHPMAAGFTVPTARIPELRARLGAFVDAGGADLVQVHDVDAIVAVDDVGEPLHDALSALGPFGQGNPVPLLMLRGVRTMGAEVKASGRLLKFRVPRAGGRALDVAWWGGADHLMAVRDRELDLLGRLAVSSYTRRVELEVVDARLSEDVGF